MTQISKRSQALKAAKAVLWDGKTPRGDDEEDFICEALINLWEPSFPAVPAAPEQWLSRAVRLHIRQQLGEHTSLCRWLRAQGVPESQLTPLNLQTHRHAWVDRMVAELEAEGD